MVGAPGGDERGVSVNYRYYYRHEKAVDPYVHGLSWGVRCEPVSGADPEDPLVALFYTEAEAAVYAAWLNLSDVADGANPPGIRAVHQDPGPRECGYCNGEGSSGDETLGPCPVCGRE